MSEKVTVSAKVSKELLKEAKERKIDISSTIRKSLEEAINQRKIEELIHLMQEVKPLLKKMGKHNRINTIREDRDSR